MEAQEVVNWITECREYSNAAKQTRMNRNRDNYEMFHLEHDFSHKEQGQSMEILSKQSMAVETTKAAFQQALADLGEWWKVEVCYPEAEELMKIRPHEITKLTNYQLERARYLSHVGNSVEQALLASLAISKTTGKLVSKPKFVAKKKGRGSSLKRWIEKIDDKTWELRFSLVSAENYYPDPDGKDLYEIEDAWIDYHELLAMAESDDDFDLEAVKKLSKGGNDELEDQTNRARETGQDAPTNSPRRKVKLTEYWGTIINSEGEIEHENIQAIVANDSVLILSPRPNPLWHQRRPYTVSPLLEVGNSVWHKALMDAPTKHNRALIEMYNLVVDAAMKQVHAVSQLRKDWLENPADVSDGIPPGASLGVTAACPPGAKVMEPLTQVQIPGEAFNVFNIMAQEFNASALTNDLRSGVMPFRAVKATEVVEASQTINAVQTGMAKNYEGRQSVPELELAWMTTCQNWGEIDREVFISLFGPQRGAELADLPAEEVFASTVNGIKFRVFGVTQTLQKSQDFQKLTTLLQTVGASPVMMEAFAKKYDLEKLLGEIMTALNVDKHKIEHSQAVQQTMMAPQEGAPEMSPDMMSQVPDAGGIQDLMGPQLPQTQFPGSPAIPGGNV